MAWPIVLLAWLWWWVGAVEALVHPGMVNSQAELDFWIGKVAASQEPWLSAYNDLGDYSAYTAKVNTSSLNMNVASPDGTDDMRDDCRAAYASTLQWFRTGTAARATKAKDLLNNITRLTNLTGDGAPLHTGYHLNRCLWAAELLKHATPDAGWSSADETAFANWLVNFIEPRLQDTDTSAGSGSNTTKSNWATIASSARLAIGVFANNQTLYDRAILDLKTMIRWYIGCQFNSQNNCASVPASFTYELCRVGNSTFGTLQGGDIEHAQMGFMGLVIGAEIAKHQGVDLFGYKHTTTPPTPADNMGIQDTLLYMDQWVFFNEGRSGSTSSGWPCQVALSNVQTGGYVINRHVQEWWTIAANHYVGSGQFAAISDWRRAAVPDDLDLTHNYNSGGGAPPDTTPPSVPTGLTVQRDSDT
jgi:hypothetical protein